MGNLFVAMKEKFTNRDHISLCLWVRFTKSNDKHNFAKCFDFFFFNFFFFHESLHLLYKIWINFQCLVCSRIRLYNVCFNREQKFISILFLPLSLAIPQIWIGRMEAKYRNIESWSEAKHFSIGRLFDLSSHSIKHQQSKENSSQPILQRRIVSFCVEVTNERKKNLMQIKLLINWCENSYTQKIIVIKTNYHHHHWGKRKTQPWMWDSWDLFFFFWRNHSRAPFTHYVKWRYDVYILEKSVPFRCNAQTGVK